MNELLPLEHNIYGADNSTLWKQIRITLKYLKCVTGNGWRKSFEQMV